MIIPDIKEETCVGCGRCYVSCYDAGHQAIEWQDEKRRPKIELDKCVGCHLCLNVCPVLDCITPGQVIFKEGAREREIKQQINYI